MNFNELWHVSKYSPIYLALNVLDFAHFDSCFCGAFYFSPVQVNARNDEC